jgi:hypothetical protein
MWLRRQMVQWVLVSGMVAFMGNACAQGMVTDNSLHSLGQQQRVHANSMVTDLGLVKLGGGDADKLKVHLAVAVSKGKPRFKISLQANPASTDYAWFETGMDNSQLKLVKYGFQAPPLRDQYGHIVTGTPGVQVFEFTATPEMLRQPTMTKVTFVLRKLGNNASSIVVSKTVTIDVESSITA